MLGNGQARPYGDTPASARQRDRRRWLVAFGASVVVSLVVLFTPRTGVPTAPPGTDKIVHFALFAALAGTALLAGARRRWLVPALIAYAVASELIQASPLLDRSASVADVVADMLGIAVGLLAAARFATSRRGGGPARP